MVGIMLQCMDSFVLGLLEGIYLGSFVGYFDGNVDGMGGPFVDIGVGVIMNASEIDAI